MLYDIIVRVMYLIVMEFFMRKYFLLLYLALISGPLFANPSMFGEVAQELDKMVALDQSLMQELFKCKNEGIKSCSIIEESLDDVIDSNSKALSEIIDKYGWISKSKFGDQADRNAWLIAQRSRDVEFQHRVLFLLENLLPEKETSPENFALLYDRIALKYETQGSELPI